MNESSYDKIYKRIIATPELQAVLSTAKEQIISLDFCETKFECILPEDFGQKATIRTRYFVNTPSGQMSSVDGRFWLDISQFLKAEDLRFAARKVFPGKKIPGYFCKEDVIWGDKTKKGTQSFVDFTRYSLERDWSSLIKEAQARLQDKTVMLQQDPAFLRLGQEALARCAISEIKKVLGGFSHLGKQVLKDALDEFIIHSLTDS